MGSSQGSGDKDVILDDPSGPNVISRVPKRWKTEWKLFTNEHEGYFWGDRYILNLDYGVDYTTL